VKGVVAPTVAYALTPAHNSATITWNAREKRIIVFNELIFRELMERISRLLSPDSKKPLRGQGGIIRHGHESTAA
jgi:hypothetical protein